MFLGFYQFRDNLVTCGIPLLCFPCGFQQVNNGWKPTLTHLVSWKEGKECVKYMPDTTARAHNGAHGYSKIASAKQCRGIPDASTPHASYTIAHLHRLDLDFDTSFYYKFLFYHSPSLVSAQLVLGLFDTICITNLYQSTSLFILWFSRNFTIGFPLRIN